MRPIRSTVARRRKVSSAQIGAGTTFCAAAALAMASSIRLEPTGTPEETVGPFAASATAHTPTAAAASRTRRGPDDDPTRIIIPLYRKLPPTFNENPLTWTGVRQDIPAAVVEGPRLWARAAAR